MSNKQHYIISWGGKAYEEDMVTIQLLVYGYCRIITQCVVPPEIVSLCAVYGAEQEHKQQEDAQRNDGDDEEDQEDEDDDLYTYNGNGYAHGNEEGFVNNGYENEGNKIGFGAQDEDDEMMNGLEDELLNPLNTDGFIE
eukprot:436253_1